MPYMKKKSPAYGFGSSQRNTDSKEDLLAPGPGKYMIPSSFPNVPSYSKEKETNEKV